MSVQVGAGENTPQQPRGRRIKPGRAYPEVDALVDEVEELSTMAPAELRRYCGRR